LKHIRGCGKRALGVRVKLPLYLTARAWFVDGCEPGGVCACTMLAVSSSTEAPKAETENIARRGESWVVVWE